MSSRFGWNSFDPGPRLVNHMLSAAATIAKCISTHPNWYQKATSIGLEFLVSGTAYDGTPEDPRVSAASVAAEVQLELGFSEDAACYFLQVLSLATPTDVLVKRWNNWNKKQLDAAASELLERGLVVSGKRASSGRGVFLAGGWLGKSTTGPGIEMWKAPHYLLWESNVSRPVLPGCPALVPYGELFTQTWQRYQSGDVPGYEQLRTTPYRSR